jgi:membrane associated rhomboid family serine protease
MSDFSPTRPTPYVSLVAISIAVGLYAMATARVRDLSHAERSWVRHLTLWPPSVAHGEWWRVLTSGFLEFRLVALLCSVAAIYWAGTQGEVLLGRARYLAVIVTSMLGSAAAGMWLDYGKIAGLAGVICGLMGALGVVVVSTGHAPWWAFGAVAVLSAWRLYADPDYAWPVLGGLLAATPATLCLLYLPRWSRARTPAAARAIGWAGMATVALVAVVVIGVAAAVTRS